MNVDSIVGIICLVLFLVTLVGCFVYSIVYDYKRSILRKEYLSKLDDYTKARILEYTEIKVSFVDCFKKTKK